MQGACILTLASRKPFCRQQDNPARPVVNTSRAVSLTVIAGEQT
jgi:hypothetical protein